MSSSLFNYRFSFEPSWFINYQETARSCAESKLTTQPNLGLLSLSHEGGVIIEDQRWTRLISHVKRLNHQSDPVASYKILLIARHGHGVHNEVMEEVGSDDWKTHWSKLPGDAKRTWFDAELVPKGVEQAKALGRFLMESIDQSGFPIPDTIYTSPLARALHTTRLVYEDIMSSQRKDFRPVVKEGLRERLTDHTCDNRRSRQWIQDSYPDYNLEPGFAEEDELWRPDRSEPIAEHVSRTQGLFEDIWRHDSGSVIALVTHSFTISTILEVIRAPHFRMGEGAMIAVLVKGERIVAL